MNAETDPSDPCDAKDLDPAELGGDPPCWAAFIEDHRHPEPVGKADMDGDVQP